MQKFSSKIGFRINPFFWVLAGLIAWINSSNIYQIVIWMLVIFGSVVFHELGHAVTAVVFGQRAKIELVAMGGVTSYSGKPLKFWQQFLVVLNGPLFGILLFVVATFLLSLKMWQNGYFLTFLYTLQIVNLFWSIVNLFPVLPLDGGQLVRILLEGFLGIRGYRIALFIGLLFALSCAVFFFLKGGFLIGALFFLFAFQSFDLWRKSRFVTSSDRSQENAVLMQKIEEKLAEGKKEEAKKLLFQLLEKIEKKGVLFLAAQQHLAFLCLEEGNPDEAYKLLIHIKNKLSDQAKLVLHKIAFDKKDYQLVKELSSDCYNLAGKGEVALINAKAFAALGESKPSGGWLRTALEQIDLNLDQILEDPVFKKVKDKAEFLEFFPYS